MRVWHSGCALGFRPRLDSNPVRRVRFPSPAPSLKGCMIKREFEVVIEKDRDGFYVGSVPSLRGCHTQAKSSLAPNVHIGSVDRAFICIPKLELGNEMGMWTHYE